MYHCRSVQSVKIKYLYKNAEHCMHVSKVGMENRKRHYPSTYTKLNVCIILAWDIV